MLWCVPLRCLATVAHGVADDGGRGQHLGSNQHPYDYHGDYPSSWNSQDSCLTSNRKQNWDFGI